MKLNLQSFLSGHPDFPMAVIRHHGRNLDTGEHSHDFLEMVFVVRGKGINTIDGESYAIAAGDVYIINIGSSHSYSSTCDLEYFDILVWPSLFNPEEWKSLEKMTGFYELFYLESLFRKEEKFQSRLRLPKNSCQEIASLVNTIFAELKDLHNGYEVLCKAYLTEMIAKLCRFYHQQLKRENQEEMIAGRKQAIEKVAQYVRENLSEAIGLDKMASLAFLSSHHFCTVFREHVGHTPIEFLNRARIEKAQELLQGTDFTVSEIAYQVGFHDTSYFIRLFKKIEGRTPVQYRRQKS